jgi:NAD(P)-dependent dehydrogenase (short-subunit alcohol dehydrogenase family)
MFLKMIGLGCFTAVISRNRIMANGIVERRSFKSMGRVEGKVAIVTGGGSGIGRASCLLLAREGASIAIADIDAKAGKKVVTEIENAGGTAQYWHVDVTNEKGVAEAFRGIYERFRKINVLVNNAGIPGYHKPSDEITESEWDRVINIDLKGVFLCTKHAAPYMKKSGGGSIVNLSSALGIVGGVDPPYHAAKGGVRALTKSDAFYYAKHNIRVNSIHPGYIMTPMVEAVLDDAPEGREAFLKSINDTILMGYIGEPNDIAYGVLYLASDESKYVTGIELIIDGGWLSL